MKNKQSKDIMIMGFMLFAVFVGAGNVILPPFVGVQSGSNWVWSAIGFIITGAGLPLLGTLAVNKADGDANRLCDKAWPGIIKVLNVFILLIIGPLFAAPRTAAFTYEFSIKPLFPEGMVTDFSVAGIQINIVSLLTSALYFIAAYFLIRSSTKGLDRIGRVFSPVLLTFIFVTILISIIKPVGAPAEKNLSNYNSFFYFGFAEGYQTMDGLGAALVGATVAQYMRKIGYGAKESTGVLAKAAVFAGLLMAAVYLGLIWVGASVSGSLNEQAGRSAVLAGSMHLVAGPFGTVLLQIIVLFACLTTASGLVITFAQFFAKLTNDRISEHTWTIFALLVCFFLSQIGVDGIIALAAPVLVAIYPVIMVIYVLNLFRDQLKDKYAFRAALIAVLILAPILFLSTTLGENNFAKKLLSAIPFDADFVYLPISIIAYLLGLAYSKTRGNAEI